MAEELDEFGIPIKKSASVEVDEFGIPLKKKENTTPVSPAPSTSGSQTVSEPTLENGGKDNFLAQANKLTNTDPKEEQFQQTGNTGRDDLKAKQTKLATKQLEKDSIETEAAKHYNAIEDNSQHPVMEELKNLHSQLNGDNENDYNVYQQINKLKVQPVSDDWRKAGSIQVSETQSLPVPNLKKSAYKTYGEMWDATQKASEKFGELKGKADLLDAELIPAIQQSRNEAAYIPDGKDEQGNEYMKLNPMQSFVEGFGGSVEAIGLGLKKLNPLYSREELKNDLKVKYLRDNVLFPKKPEGTGAELTGMLGGVTPLILSGGTGATGYGALAVNALTFGTMDLGGGMYEGFAEGKAKGMSDDEAMDFADKIGIEKGVTGTVLGATMPMQSALGRKIFINKAEAGALKTFLAEQGVMVPTFMSKTLIDNLGAKAVGSERDLTEGVAESGASAFIIGAMTHAIATIPKLPKATKDIFENTIAKNYGSLNGVISKAVSDGAIDFSTSQRIAEKAKAFEAIGKDLAPKQEAEQLPIQIEIDNLEKQKEGKTGLVKDEAEQRIDELTDELKEKRGSPLSNKEQKEYETILAKEEQAPAEGKPKPKLTDLEKARKKHFEKRIKIAEKNNEIIEKERLKLEEEQAVKNDIELEPTVAEPKAEEVKVEESVEPMAEVSQEETKSATETNVEEPKQVAEDLTDVEANKFIDDHAVQGKIQKSDYRPNFGLSSEELTRGLEQIKKGQTDKVAAKRVLDKIAEWKRQGYVDMLAGGGGAKSSMSKVSVPFEVMKEASDLSDVQLQRVGELGDAIDKSNIDEVVEKFTDADGNLDRVKLAQELADAKGKFYFGDLIGLSEKELLNLQTLLTDEKSGTTVEIPDTTSSSKVKYARKSGEEQSSTGETDPTQEVTPVGKEVSFKHAGQNTKGIVTGIDAKGNLLVTEKGKGKYPDTKHVVKAENATVIEKEVADKSGKDFINEGWNEIKDALTNPTGTLALNPKLVTGFAKIGYGLIKEGNATIKNVIDKIKDYIKANGGWGNITEKDFNESVKDIKAKIDELNQKSFLETVKDSPTTSKEMAEKTAELDQFYETLHNKEALAAADKKIAEDLGKAKEFVMSDAAPSAEKSAMAVRLIKHFESVKDFDSAIEVLNAYDNQLRESGRFIQAASLWNRLDPNTIVRVANKEAKKLGQDLPPDVQKEILRRMAEVQKLPEGTERDKGTLEVLNYIADQLPLSPLDWFDAYRYQNMLSNPRSHERNIWGNLLNVFATEPASLAMKSGFDLFSNIQNPEARDAKFSQIPTYYKDALMNIPNAFIAAKETFRNGYVADKILDIGNTTSQIEALRRTKLPKYLTVVTRFLESQDRFFSVLIGQGEKMRLMRNGVGEADATARATKLAEEYLYREKLDPSDKSKPYFVGALDGLGQGINYLRKIPRIGKGLSWFVPFVTTPINVAKMGVKFSPLGFVGGKDMYSSPNAKTTIANATLGSIMTGVGATMAMQGLTSWAAPKDKKERELFYASGRKPYSVKIGDKWVPMAYFGPFGLSLALPAAVKHFQEDTKTALTDGEIEQVKDAILSTSGFITSQTPLSSVDGFFKTIGGDDDYTIDKVTGYVTSQAIPLAGMVRYINTILDPVYRKSKGYVESIESGIPELSKELDPIKTPDGKDAEREPTNALLPYDLGFSDEDYEIMLKVRREKAQKAELKKQNKKDKAKGFSSPKFKGFTGFKKKQ
jgi:hypothetical protein